jgi:hypothetical protein
MTSNNKTTKDFSSAVVLEICGVEISGNVIAFEAMSYKNSVNPIISPNPMAIY